MLLINHNMPGYLPDSEPAEYDVTSWPDMCAAVREYCQSAELSITADESRAIAAAVRDTGRGAIMLVSVHGYAAELFATREA